MLVKERTNVYDFEFYLVFVTEKRLHIFLDDELKNDMKVILMNLANNNGISVSRLDVFSNHVRMQLSFRPKYAPTNVVKSLKGTSARVWFKKHPELEHNEINGHLWASGFFMATVGSVSDSFVAHYVDNNFS